MRTSSGFTTALRGKVELVYTPRLSAKWRSAAPRAVLSAPNQEWAIDFASDVTSAQQRIRIFSVVDAHTRECLALEVDTSFPSRRVTRVLDNLISTRGRPAGLRSDNGPELCSRHYLAWCLERHVQPIHIQPGRPMQNGRVESFNGRFRDECLNANWFATLNEAREKIELWRAEYNSERPHSSLAYRTPEEFARSCSELTNRMGSPPIPPCRPS